MSETPPNGERLQVELVSESAVPLSLIIKVFVVGFTLATILPIAVVLYLNHQTTQDQLDQNERIISVLCREFNTRNLALQEILLDLNVPAYRLTPLDRRSCNPSNISQR